MNDRFKFRAWDELNKIMHYDFQFIRDWSNGGWIIFQSDKQKLGWNASDKFTLNVYPNPYFAEQLKIQQSTGLKDKNGKLIYEGDVVTYDDRDIYPYHTPIFNAVIEMRKYQWCMVYYSKDIINADTREPAEQKTWLGFDDFITSRIEVIGNKFENPELLKECE